MLFCEVWMHLKTKVRMTVLFFELFHALHQLKHQNTQKHHFMTVSNNQRNSTCTWQTQRTTDTS